MDLKKAKQLIKDGMPLREVEAKTGIHYATLSRYAQAWGLELKRGRRKGSPNKPKGGKE